MPTWLEGACVAVIPLCALESQHLEHAYGQFPL